MSSSAIAGNHFSSGIVSRIKVIKSGGNTRELTAGPRVDSSFYFTGQMGWEVSNENILCDSEDETRWFDCGFVILKYVPKRKIGRFER